MGLMLWYAPGGCLAASGNSTEAAPNAAGLHLEGQATALWVGHLALLFGVDRKISEGRGWLALLALHTTSLT